MMLPANDDAHQTFEFIRFDIPAPEAIKAAGLDWVSGKAAGEDAGFVQNHYYIDLRNMSWRAARAVASFEIDLIAMRIGVRSQQQHDDFQDALEDAGAGLMGLDLGVAGVVAALSAARCVPITSCNGGAFGGDHYEPTPVVAFYCRPAALPLVLRCAGAAGVSPRPGLLGEVVIQAADIRDMLRFAETLLAAQSEFSALRLPAAHVSAQGQAGRRKRRPPSPKNLELFSLHAETDAEPDENNC